MTETATCFIPNDAELDTEAVRTMQQAFDDAFASLARGGIPVEDEAAVRAMLAQCVVDLYKAGRLDQGEIRDRTNLHLRLLRGKFAGR
jgi:hypothetical protein